MMKIEGNIRKMQVENLQPVRYKLPVGKELIDMNALIGRSLSVSWNKEINCISCGKKTIKSFGQGFCFPCFKTAPEAAPCILKPEECEAHLGAARNMEWSEKNCLTDHYVYLALSSNVKVGVTRSGQIPTRWIDQGAVQAIILAQVPNRHTAGVLEVEMKKYFTDKTSWQKMLKGELVEADLLSEKEKAVAQMPFAFRQYAFDDNTVHSFDYPLDKYPVKVKSINLDKELKFSGLLSGIKGQYLVFEDGRVINMRKYTGYKLTFEF